MFIALAATILMCVSHSFFQPVASLSFATARYANPLDSVLHSTPSLAPVVSQADKHELQVIYTRVERDAQNKPKFTQFSYRLDDKAYFNPASLVKLPVAVLALEKLNRLRQQAPTLSRNSIMATGVAGRCQTPVPFAAPADSDRAATVGNYIKGMLLVSDNRSYNRLYEFLGQQYLHKRLAELGYPAVRIVRRFAPCDTAANRCTNPVTFHDAQGSVLFKQAAACNPSPLRHPLGQVVKGQAHYAAGKLVNKPYDFTTANYLSLQTATDFLRTVLFPESASDGHRPRLSTQDYAFLKQYLGSTPEEAQFRLYKAPQYYHSYKKYLYYGRQRQVPIRTGLRIYNVVGMSYGYLADCAYFVDDQSKAEFLLSAVLYVNSDGILNDGSYEYTSVGLPFFVNLGRAILSMEQERPRR
jgi:hypothetical protein